MTIPKILSEEHFAKDDFLNLFQKTFSINDRKKFIEKIQPKYEEIEHFNGYKKALSDFQRQYDASHFENFRSYSAIREDDVKILLSESHVLLNKDLSEYEFNELFKQAVILLTDIIKPLTDYQIEILYYFSQNYEKFTLITLEPFLCNILGFSLFFSLFLPLHKTGALSFLIYKSISLRKYLLLTFGEKILKGVYYFSKRITANISMKNIVLYTASVPLGVYAFNSILDYMKKHIILKTTTKSLFIKEVYQLKQHVSRISFETGLFTGSFLKGLVLGLVLPYQGNFKKITDFFYR